jgi:hypothetical protein
VTQLTPSSTLYRVELGLGELTIVHALPSQCSMSVNSPLSVVAAYPTPHQSMLEGQLTPTSSLSCTGRVSAELTIVHEEPSKAR